MHRRGLGVKGLARLLAGPDAAESEVNNRRRALQRYLRGGTPTPRLAREIEQRLGLAAGSLPTYEPRRTSHPSLGERVRRLEEWARDVDAWRRALAAGAELAEVEIRALEALAAAGERGRSASRRGGG